MNGKGRGDGAGDPPLPVPEIAAQPETATETGQFAHLEGAGCGKSGRRTVMR